MQQVQELYQELRLQKSNQGIALLKMARAHNGKKTSPETIEARIKAAKALELRMEGVSFDRIAEEAGYNSRQAAHEAVKRALDRIEREPAEALVKLDLERIDVMWQIQYLNAQSGDVQAMAACMKLMERRAKLLGLDAPAKTENKTEVTTRTLDPIADDEFLG